MYRTIVSAIALAGCIALLRCAERTHANYFALADIVPIGVRDEVVPGLLDNAREFDTPFFREFQLRHAPAPLRLNDQVEKNYFFPTFYDGVTVAVAMFFCSYEAASKLMPLPDMRPVSMGRGRAMVIFSSYQYNRVLGIEPYREIAISIPVLVRTESMLPLYPMVAENFPGMGVYVLSMPVTTLENKIRGREIWGLAKNVEKIDFAVEAGGYRTSATDGEGRPYLSFFVPFVGDETEIDRTFQIYTVHGGQLLRAPSRGRGTYLVRRFAGRLLGDPAAVPEREYLRLGTGPMADTLRGLKIEPHPFQFQFGKNVSSSFDLPVPVAN